MIQILNNLNYAQKSGGELDVITSFDVEIDKETALISYETKEKYRHQGYASKGLNLLRETLFSDDNILFLELIHLSGDYSRKVAENGGFFSRNGSLEYWVSLNPNAEQIINNKLQSLDISSTKYKRTRKLLDKAETLRKVETLAKQKMQAKLDGLLQQREAEDNEDYKNSLETEISHLQGIIESQDVKKLQILYFCLFGGF